MLLLQAFIIIRPRQTFPWMIFYFLYSWQYLKKLLNGQRFIWVLFACSSNFFMNAIRSGAIQGFLLSNIRRKDLTDALRGLIEAKHWNTLSKQMQWHRLGWINRGMIEKARQDLETNFRSSDKSKWTIEAKLTWVTWGTRGERDVIRLRNPTEDKGAFRRMLTSADPSHKVLTKMAARLLEVRRRTVFLYHSFSCLLET